MESVWQAFVEAIAAGEDERTELLALQLDGGDQPALLALLDEAGDGRWWAIRGLAQVGNEEGIAAVAGALSDPDAMTRAAAAHALGQLAARHPAKSAAYLPMLGDRFADEDGFVRQQAVEGMARAGAAALPVLEGLVAVHQEQVVRVRAAATLRHMRDMRCAGVLFRLLNDENHLVHTYAYEALDDLGLLDNLLLAP